MKVGKSVGWFSGAIIAFVMMYVIMKVLFVDSFIVSGDSMEPTLHNGERIWVDKTLFGARIYTDYDFSKTTLNSIRLLGRRRIKVGDVVVFNYPFGKSKDTISFKINYVYIKRCIGVPGDSVRIKDGHYAFSDKIDVVPKQYQEILEGCDDESLMEDQVELMAFQVNKGLKWTIKDFGPLYVPKKGDSLSMDASNYKSYRRLIQYETGERPHLDNAGETVLLGDKVITSYRFRQNWYFMGGDNVLNSHDSRFFGLVPEDYIIGIVRGK